MSDILGLQEMTTLVARLSKASHENILTWEETADEDTFACNLSPKISVRIVKSPSSDPDGPGDEYSLYIYRQTKLLAEVDYNSFEVESFRQTFGKYPYHFLKELFLLAKYAALNVLGELRSVNEELKKMIEDPPPPF